MPAFRPSKAGASWTPPHRGTSVGWLDDADSYPPASDPSRADDLEFIRAGEVVLAPLRAPGDRCGARWRETRANRWRHHGALGRLAGWTTKWAVDRLRALGS